MSQRTRRILASLLFAVAALALAQAQDAPASRFAAQDQLALAQEPGGDPFATLYVTTEVEVLEQDGDASRVRVHGVAQPSEDGRLSDVFTDDTNATRVAHISDPSAVHTSGDGDWVEVQLEGWVASDGLAETLEPMFEEAAAIYQENCTRCHTGYAAPVEVLRTRVPNARVERIITNMARGTDVSDEHVNLIIQWFQKHPGGL